MGQNKILLLSFLILIFSSDILGQKLDSSFYHKYNIYKSVDSVVYTETFHKNGTLMTEGWIIHETARNNQNIYNIIVPKDEITYFEHLVGIHNDYNDKGLLISTTNIPLDHESEISEVVYDEYGNIAKSVIRKEKETLSLNQNGINTKSDYTRNSQGNEYYIVKLYKKGKIYSESRYVDGWTKDGCWKWFQEDGSLRKQVYYQNGKKINHNCE